MRDALDTALKTALKAQEKRRVTTLRLILAAIKDRDIAGRGAGKDRSSDDEILQLLSKMIKQREESARLYAEGGRPDLQEQELEEIEIIREFLPRQLEDDEIAALVDGAIAEVGAAGVRDLGKVMALLKERHPGQMDFAKASTMAKSRLS
ncbi:MAG TPA: GatB/YqeY domain-containing protein [Methylomirabilota bacterium]|nr:GatB/YqeY domain-containing protein [Methylomirabilota bacterium]